MNAATIPPPTLLAILTRILVIATHILRGINIQASTTTILKTILAANEAATRIGRAIRLLTLLINRIHTHGLAPFAPARPASATTTRRERKPQPIRFHPGNADAAFIRRPFHVVVAAITRELHLAARILGVPVPEQLQALCLHAAIASTALHPGAQHPAAHPPGEQPPAASPAPTTTHPTPTPAEAPLPPPPHHHIPTPAKTLEL